MARWFIFSLVVAVLFVCIQAAPAQEDTSANALQEAYAKTMENISKSVESMMKNPEFQSLVKDTSEFFNKAAETIKNEAGKLIPKTEEPAKN